MCRPNEFRKRFAAPIASRTFAGENFGHAWRDGWVLGQLPGSPATTMIMPDGGWPGKESSKEIPKKLVLARFFGASHLFPSLNLDARGPLASSNLNIPPKTTGGRFSLAGRWPTCDRLLCVTCIPPLV